MVFVGETTVALPETRPQYQKETSLPIINFQRLCSISGVYELGCPP